MIQIIRMFCLATLAALFLVTPADAKKGEIKLENAYPHELHLRLGRARAVLAPGDTTTLEVGLNKTHKIRRFLNTGEAQRVLDDYYLWVPEEKPDTVSYYKEVKFGEVQHGVLINESPASASVILSSGASGDSVSVGDMLCVFVLPYKLLTGVVEFHTNPRRVVNVTFQAPNDIRRDQLFKGNPVDFILRITVQNYKDALVVR